MFALMRERLMVHRRNLAQVSGGERELRNEYSKPFNRACLDSLSIMTAHSSYDGIPAIANTRKFLIVALINRTPHRPFD